MPLAAAGTDVAPVLLALALVLVAAKVGAEAAVRLRQPAVVGEIVAGMVLGNLGLAGVHGLEFLKGPSLDLLAELGILILLFETGIEATVPQMLRTGLPALRVGVVGVVVAPALGSAVSWLFAPQASGYTHLFVGAILAATSVGLTARVLKDLGRTRTPEARLILGAAVIDDVLGLVVLATVSALIASADAGTALGVGPIAWIVAKAVLFLVVAVVVGLWAAPRMFALVLGWRGEGLLLVSSLAFCFGTAYVATLFGLAPIVGAFTAGLVLEEAHFEGLAHKEGYDPKDFLQPLVSLLLPVFFVLIGMRVDAGQFADPYVLALAGVLAVAAVVGKLACGLVVGRGADPWVVGIGMVPRGEVGFIFAGIGTTLTLGGEPVIAPKVFAAVVLVVILTTLLTPPALAARFLRLAPPPEGLRPEPLPGSDGPVGLT
jgi:Kef-type K+ transport system membrane component KefB